jgi:aromatic ring-opening dioxygenase LigB subunit
MLPLRGEKMGVVFACIAPHGAETISELAGDMFEAFSETREGMEKLGSLFKEREIATVVIATPHGLRLEATMGVVTSEFTEGCLEEKHAKVALRSQCDRQLAREIVQEAMKSGLPVVGANYGTSDGPASCMPMDWGTLIPLWFLMKDCQTKPMVVVVTPSREIPLENLLRFGRIIAEASESSDKRVAFVASADQGHAHRADGPYGFNPASAEFDDIVKHAVEKNDLLPLLRLSPRFIEDAKPDSVWQLAMLQGVLEHTPMNACLLSYQRPTYFGLLCAAYSPIEKRAVTPFR